MGQILFPRVSALFNCMCSAFFQYAVFQWWNAIMLIFSTIVIIFCSRYCIQQVSLRLSLFQGDDTMTGDGGEYLRPEDLKELGDDSLPSSQFLDGMNYLRYSLEGGRSDRYSPKALPLRWRCRQDHWRFTGVLSSGRFVYYLKAFSNNFVSVLKATEA